MMRQTVQRVNCIVQGQIRSKPPKYSSVQSPLAVVLLQILLATKRVSELTEYPIIILIPDRPKLKTLPFPKNTQFCDLNPEKNCCQNYSCSHFSYLLAGETGPVSYKYHLVDEVAIE